MGLFTAIPAHQKYKQLLSVAKNSTHIQLQIQRVPSTNCVITLPPLLHFYLAVDMSLVPTSMNLKEYIIDQLNKSVERKLISAEQFPHRFETADVE